MDNKAFISIEFLFSIFIILIISTGLLVYSHNAIGSSLNIESNFHHRMILDSVADTINQVDSHSEGYSKYLELPKTDEDYILLFEGNKLTIEYANKKGETILPFVDSYASYKLYGEHIYIVEKTHEGRILIR